MFKIQDALNLPVMTPAEVVAGRSGLNREIKWVHTVDIPDAQYEWEREGVLLLTSMYGVHDDLARQKALIPKLVEQGFAGLVHSTGIYLDRTPDVIKEQADALGFPIIETPRSLLFIDVTEEILQRIVNQQYRLLRQSNRIHNTLTKLVLQGGDLQRLADTLANLLGRSITIESASFRVLAAASVGEIDPARARAIESGRTSPALVKHLQTEGIYHQLQEQKRPIRVPPMAEMGLTIERFVAPIIVHQSILGYFWIIAGEQGLSPLDELAIQNAATVAALILFNEQTKRRAQDELQGDLVLQLIRGVDDVHAVLELGRQIGFLLDRDLQVCVARASSGLETVHQDAAAWLQDHGVKSLTSIYEDQLVMIFSMEPRTEALPLESLRKAIDFPGSQLVLGVGRRSTAITENNLSVQKSYAEAAEAALVGQSLQRGFVEFESLELLHWLFHVPIHQVSGNRYWQVVQSLYQSDLDHETDLLKSMKVYLDHGGAIASAAEALFVHRNTLLNRITRIEELTRLNLRGPEERLNIQLAIRMWELQQGPIR